jgi:hypothetical protein
MGAGKGLNCLCALYPAYRRASSRVMAFGHLQRPYFIFKNETLFSVVDTNARIGAFSTALK